MSDSRFDRTKARIEKMKQKSKAPSGVINQRKSLRRTVQRYLDLKKQLENIKHLNGNIDPVMAEMDLIWCKLTPKEKDAINNGESDEALL